jgi:hypothetical protein
VTEGVFEIDRIYDDKSAEVTLLLRKFLRANGSSTTSLKALRQMDRLQALGTTQQPTLSCSTSFKFRNGGDTNSVDIDLSQTGYN